MGVHPRRPPSLALGSPTPICPRALCPSLHFASSRRREAGGSEGPPLLHPCTRADSCTLLHPVAAPPTNAPRPVRPSRMLLHACPTRCCATGACPSAGCSWHLPRRGHSDGGRLHPNADVDRLRNTKMGGSVSAFVCGPLLSPATQAFVVNGLALFRYRYTGSENTSVPALVASGRGWEWLWLWLWRRCSLLADGAPSVPLVGQFWLLRWAAGGCTGSPGTRGRRGRGGVGGRQRRCGWYRRGCAAGGRWKIGA
jgi:hypothetical protein